MSIKKTGLILLSVCIFLGIFSAKSHAASCWSMNPAHFAFGDVTSGEAAQTNATLEYQCNDYDPEAEYIRLCLALTSGGPLELNTNPASTPLQFMVYSADDPNTDLDTGYAEKIIHLAANEGNGSHYFELLAKIPAGQTGLKAGDYHNYGVSLTLKYAYHSTLAGLPACSSVTDNGVADSFDVTANVKEGCELVSVDPIAFGRKNPAANDKLSGNATGNITVRCPVNSSFTVGLGAGQHNDGNSRRMCNGADCVVYELYQDSGHSLAWNDSDMKKTELSATGNNMSLTVYGNIPSQEWVKAGDYKDTVIVTLTY